MLLKAQAASACHTIAASLFSLCKGLESEAAESGETCGEYTGQQE